MNSIKVKAIIVSILTATLIIPCFRPTTGLRNIKDFLKARSSTRAVSQKYREDEDLIVSYWKKLGELRGDTIDPLDPNALYNTVSSLDGVSNVSAKVVSISGGQIKEKEDFKIEDNNSQIDGIEITCTVESPESFMEQLSSLNLVYESINYVALKNTFILIFNTKGGL